MVVILVVEIKQSVYWGVNMNIEMLFIPIISVAIATYIAQISWVISELFNPIDKFTKKQFWCGLIPFVKPIIACYIRYKRLK